MRLGALAIVLAATTAAADPLADFVARAPRLAAALAPLHLRDGHPCAFDGGDDEPPVRDRTPEVVAPDGSAIALMTTLELDRAASKRFHVPAGTANVVLVLQRTGAITLVAPQSFPLCTSGAAQDVRWSGDARRVLAEIDSGHGLRIALLDLGSGALIADAFAAADALASPQLRHLAWVPWSAEWPEEHPDQFEVEIDDRTVWKGSASDFAWPSEDSFTFCAGGRRIRVVHGRASKIGGCAP
ncbi:MAG TPA: hypothetical protein VLX92_20815 [Kofleriaceae bacterium]|nr:hypothetical protein [Kofleriaceae bacterium]